MGTFSSAAAIFSLTGVGNSTKQNVQGLETIGVGQTNVSLPTGSPAYALGVNFGTSGDSITLNPLTGVLSGGTAASKAYVTSNISLNPANNDTILVGEITYTFKSSAAGAGQVLIGADAEDTRDNLISEVNGSGFGPANADAEASAGSGASITFEASVAGSAGNDIPIEVSADSSWSPPPTAFSGGSDGAIAGTYEGDGNDFEGVTLPEVDNAHAFLLVVTTGRVILSDGADYSVPVRRFSSTQPGFALVVSDQLDFDGSVTITCDEGPATMHLTNICKIPA